MFETGSDGRFVLTGLVSGKYKVILRDAGRTIRWRPSDSGHNVSLSMGERIENLTLVYEGSYAISGYVYDSEGNPLEGLQVDAGNTRFLGNTPGHSTTDENGWFELLNLGDGRYNVRVTSPRGKEVMERNVEGGRDDIVLVIPL